MANIENFNLDAFAENETQHEAQPNNKHKETPASSGTLNFADSTSADVEAVAKMLISRNIDITAGYGNWRNLGFALADEFGESGRSLFHDLSRMNSEYKATECDKQYNACLKSHGHGITIKSFFQMAKDGGVDLSEYGREKIREQHSLESVQQQFCASCANVPPCTNSVNSVKTADFDVFDGFVQGGTLAQVAQNAEDDDAIIESGKTFSDQIKKEDLPPILHTVYDSQDTFVGKDKMLLGTLNLISGLLPKSYYSIYDRRKVFTPLYKIVYGKFATSKGDLEACKHILTPIKKEMRAKYEAEKAEHESAKAEWDNKNKKERGPEPKEPVLHSPFVSANSSASAVYRTLDSNDGWAEMFETEADTLACMLSNKEYGDYSDLLRKAHHHEDIAMKRVTDNVDIEIEKPRLSVFLTCTGSQIPILLPSNNIANGLASRFLFYGLPKPELRFRNVFENDKHPIEDIYKELGEKIMPLYHALEARKNRPIQFVLNEDQKKEFVLTFDDILHEQFYMLGDGIEGFIFRIALECFRIAMILSALRKLSEWYALDDVTRQHNGIFDDDEQAIGCCKQDFDTAITIINCLINHTGRVYAVIGSSDNDPFSQLKEQPSAEIKKYYTALPEGCKFKTNEAIKIAIDLNIPERTAKRYLGDLVTKFQMLDHPRKGVYAKPIRQEKTNT